MKWERIAKSYRDHAHKLRRALAGALELHRSNRWGRDEIEGAARRDYQRIFGHPVSTRTVQRALQRVIARDGGQNDFTKLELYLPDVIEKRPTPAAFEQAAKTMPELAQAVLGVAEANAPTQIETQLIWNAACEEWLRISQAGASATRAKKIVLAGLEQSGVYLGRSYSAIRLNFSRKLEIWMHGGYTAASLRDKRPERSGARRGLPLSADDERLLIARSVTGSLSKAWRETLRSGELSAEVVQSFIGNPASKSYVPQRVRDLVGPKAEMLYDIHRGPRQAALKGAYISRDWSAVSPGDWYSADDTTLPLYYWEEDERGNPRVLRGQCLVMNDCRTGRILAFALHSERNYTAKVIRGLILSAHDSYGLPREGFFFERGTWASAKILKGAADEVPGDETELGLREWVKFKHALPGNARAKTIERIIGLLQERMEDQPGYCGRNEMIEKFERVQRQKLDVDSGKIHPRECFMHRDEWVQRLSEICDAYNCESQEGRMIQGHSPREAWDTGFDFSRPLIRLDGGLRYLLANHRRPLKVTRNGLCIQIGKERIWFRNEITGQNIGRTVQVYFNPDDLSSVFMKISTGLTGAAVIPAAPVIPAMSATREEIGAAQASVAAHNRPARTLYQAIAPHFPKNGPSHFRMNVATPEVLNESREIAADQAAIKAETGKREKIHRQIDRQSRKLGVTLNHGAVSDERRLAGLQLLEEANRDE